MTTPLSKILCVSAVTSPHWYNYDRESYCHHSNIGHHCYLCNNNCNCCALGCRDDVITTDVRLYSCNNSRITGPIFIKSGMDVVIDAKSTIVAAAVVLVAVVLLVVVIVEVAVMLVATLPAVLVAAEQFLLAVVTTLVVAVAAVVSGLRDGDRGVGVGRGVCVSIVILRVTFKVAIILMVVALRVIVVVLFVVVVVVVLADMNM